MNEDKDDKNEVEKKEEKCVQKDNNIFIIKCRIPKAGIVRVNQYLS